MRGRGYACRLPLNDNIKNYLLRYKYIYTNEGLDDYYFLNGNFYNNYKSVIENLGFNKIEKELIKNYNALDIIYFDEELMHLFLNNPKFHFVWDGYGGYVCSTDDSKLNIYIKDLCLCHDLEENKIVLGAFLIDVLNCSEQSKLILEPFILEDEKRKYDFHYYNYKNLILGQWLEVEELDIYTVLLEGIKIINYIFFNKYKLNLYKTEYELRDLQFFMPLFFPTKINWYNFMLELSKIFIDNINSGDLKDLIRSNYDKMRNKDSFSLEDLKGSREFTIFKIYFGQYSLFHENSFKKLDEIRKKRTEPAHKIFVNDLNYLYTQEQDQILKNLYRVIYNIIKVEDTDYKYLKEYKNGEYECFFGEKGSISEDNGFNSKGFHYYNGYIRLINDKYKVKDSEILIAGNDINIIQKELTEHIKKNFKLSDSNIKIIVDAMLSLEICIPNNAELESFFYGQAYIQQFYGKCRNYKNKGKKEYKEFIKNDYKYIFLLADSTDLYYSLEKTINLIKKNPMKIFGSGIIMYLLSNNFSQDENNLFLKSKTDIKLLKNIWD